MDWLAWLLLIIAYLYWTKLYATRQLPKSIERKLEYNKNRPLSRDYLNDLDQTELKMEYAFNWFLFPIALPLNIIKRIIDRSVDRELE